MKQVEGLEMQHSQDPHLQVGEPQIGRISQSHNQGVRGLSPTLVFPVQGTCTRKTSGFEKPAGLTSQRARGLQEIDNSTLKGRAQNLSCSESWHRGSSLKGAWVRPIC